MQFRLENHTQLVRLALELNAEAHSNVSVTIDYVWNPKQAIQVGLWPSSHLTYDAWFVDWMNNVPAADIAFWHDGIDVAEEAQKMKTIGTWIWKSLEEHKREAVASASSLPLLLYARELLYQGSKRPKTEMSLFRSPLSRTIRRADVRDGRVVLDGEEWRVVPVTRYAAGMSKGLYFGEDRPLDSCGTFFYLEPESTTYLAFKTSFRAFNKTEAALALGIATEEDEGVQTMLKHSRGAYPRNLMMTPEEAYSALHPGVLLPAGDVSDEPRYAGVYLDLYAEEDIWDQPLCNTAAEEGYDVVILESMVGKYQVVTEVLDTRSREESFSSLLYVVAE